MVLFQAKEIDPCGQSLLLSCSFQLALKQPLCFGSARLALNFKPGAGEEILESSGVEFQASARDILLHFLMCMANSY